MSTMNKKSTKDEKYENMLKKIDLKLDSSANKGALNDNNNDGFIQVKGPEHKSVSLNDLIRKIENDPNAQNAAQLKNQASDLETRATLFNEAPSLKKQEELERKANYKIVKKDVEKWQNVIKKNREAKHLDFTEKRDNKFRINSNILETMSKTPFENKIEAKLKELNLYKEEDIREKEREALAKLNPDESSRKQKELTKSRNLMFYQELKNKRISKIKSRLYHKIKKKRELKTQEKLAAMDGADPEVQLRELDELEQKRAEERVSLRHKNKSKYLQELVRFGGSNKKEILQAQNDIASMRREILKKVNLDQKSRLQDALDDDEKDMNDEEFKSKLMSEIEKELHEDNGDNKKTTGFLKRMMDNQREANRKEAEAMLEKLKNVEKLEDFELSEGDEENPDDLDEEERAEREKEKKAKAAAAAATHEFSGRKKFQKDEANPVNLQLKDIKVNKSQKADQVLKNFISNEEEQQGVTIEELKGNNKASKNKNKEKDAGYSSKLDSQVIQNEDEEEVPKTQSESKKSKKKNNNSSLDKDDLTAGLNLDGVKQKYGKANEKAFLEAEIEKFNEENRKDLYQDLSNFNVVDSNLFDEEFQKEKEELYEGEIPKEEKTMKGWGSWAGIGVKEKKVDPNIELQKKMKKIEELKKKRIDGDLNHVIINEERNKQVTKFLVSDLPHPYKSAEQFDYIQGVPLGPEWNSLKNHQKLVKPKIITRAGEIIKPIKAPKNQRKDL